LSFNQQVILGVLQRGFMHHLAGACLEIGVSHVHQAGQLVHVDGQFEVVAEEVKRAGNPPDLPRLMQPRTQLGTSSICPQLAPDPLHTPRVWKGVGPGATSLLAISAGSKVTQIPDARRGITRGPAWFAADDPGWAGHLSVGVGTSHIAPGPPAVFR